MKTKLHRWLRLIALLTATVFALVCCGDDEDDPATPDGGGALPTVDGSPTFDASTPDTFAPDGAPLKLTSCIERPTDLPRPPTGRLPCELLPPGLTL